MGIAITALGGLGVLWQVDQAASRPASAGPPPFFCPLGGHGDYARVPDWTNSSANSTSH